MDDLPSKNGDFHSCVELEQDMFVWILKIREKQYIVRWRSNDCVWSSQPLASSFMRNAGTVKFVHSHLHIIPASLYLSII